MARRSSLIGLLLLALLLGAGGRALWLWLDRPIERVSIRGELHHVSADYLRNKLAPLVQGQTWLSVDIDAMREQAREIGWLREVRLHREWPNALRFELEEQVPVARWNDDRLLNAEGEPFDFTPVTPPEGLPDLSGPEGSGAEVLAYHDQLVSRFADQHLDVRQLRLEPRGAWRFQLDDGVWVMLGRNHRAGRLERFEAAWRRELGEWASHIRYIDLRYPNGVAVAWHGETEPVEGDSEVEG
ncbi:cell division protein FtsQ/DivIB [Halomonas elongata]|uniref:Cell division protein FtsQ n=2 Tax=Halomonas elongata TaxID=2746 RepID=E1V9L5_HALED|nr:cell division protein FtsQ/DivIB [Halomonas elongata]MBW5798556.1 cell division protein FtsQ/DivIB [Halomonas elongata]MDL4862592.1 cell division protein FtsQ/DivIB [Halomonas elongata]OBX37226.1 cell division protein FtsQ [Halomonas elongata]RAW08174.1 cell division protein FtsQ [Halomonas elongata]WBF19092.1 cell division protein FtsQ/DivIB [Halomonas elongata]